MRIIPAIYVEHTPFLRGVLRIRRVNDRVYILVRVPWKKEGL